MHTRTHVHTERSRSSSAVVVSSAGVARARKKPGNLSRSRSSERNVESRRPVSNTMQTRALACVRLNVCRVGQKRRASRRSFARNSRINAFKAPETAREHFRGSISSIRRCGRYFSRLLFCRDDVDELFR